MLHLRCLAGFEYAAGNHSFSESVASNKHDNGHCSDKENNIFIGVIHLVPEQNFPKN